MIKIEEDFQAWEVFKDIKEYRWLFNKLEVALRQGLHAGPAATAPHSAGTFIHRPVYNLYGMGIGAKKFEYNQSMYSSMINNGVVPPGHFWCEWVNGTHYSIDYERKENTWDIRSVLVGKHGSKDNLTRFESWTKVPRYRAFFLQYINKNILELPFINDYRVNKVNIEMIDNTIIEIHLRWGNDPFDELEIGTTIVPVWMDQEIPEGEWMGNLHEDLEQYSASGHLSDVRKGYIIKRP